jgi:hypothetical protein
MKGGKRKMKAAKIGAVFMVSVMALAALGVAYAHWRDEIYITAKVDMGKLGFGFVDQWTDDSGPNYEDPGGDLFPADPSQGHYDPDCPEGINRQCGVSYPPHQDDPKNVASTNCVMKNLKYWHDGTPMIHERTQKECFDLIEVTLNNTYPNYAPNLHFNIANAGTVPIDILGFWLVDDGIPGNGFADGINEPATWFFMNICTMYKLDIYDDGNAVPVVEIGLFRGIGVDEQIDPCDEDEYGVSFHILQEYPQCTTLEFELKIYGVQWNWPIIPPYLPTEPPLPPIP